MRKIVLDYKYKNCIETFSPKWFMLSINPDMKIATLIEKSTMRKRRFIYSREVINPDEIRITVIGELEEMGEKFPPKNPLDWKNQKAKEVNPIA